MGIENNVFSVDNRPWRFSSSEREGMFHEALQRILSPSRFKQGIFWNVASIAFLGVSGICINVVILACQGPEALGVFNQVFAFHVVISQIAVGGLHFSVLKHCSYEQDNFDKCAVIASSALMLVGAAGIVVSLSLLGLRHTIGSVLGSPAVARGLAFVVPGLAFFSLNKVLLLTMNGLRHMRAFALFQALRYGLVLVSVVAIVILGYPGSHLPLSLSIAEIVLFFVMMLYINLRLFRLKVSLSSEMRGWFRRHISFGGRGFLSGVLRNMNVRVDILMLGYFMSDMMVGIYSFASTFAEGFGQLDTVIRRNVDPIVGKCFAQDDRDGIRELSRRIRRTFFPMMAILGGVLVAGFPIFIRLLAPNGESRQSWGVFAILVAGIVLACGYRPFLSVLLQGGRPGTFTILIACTLLVNVVLNCCLIPLIGLYGAASATASVYLMEALAIVILARRFFGIRL